MIASLIRLHMKFKLKNAKKLDKAQAFQPVALSSSSFPVNDLPSEQADNIIRTFIKKSSVFGKLCFKKFTLNVCYT